MNININYKHNCLYCNNNRFVFSENNEKTICPACFSYELRCNSSNIPKEYWDLLPQHYKTQVFPGLDSLKRKQVFEYIIEYIKKLPYNKDLGKGFFIYGAPSSQCGMTLLLTFILRTALEWGYTSYFSDFSDFIISISNFDEWEFNSQKYLTVDYLLLDNINANCQNNPYVLERLNSILNYRNRHCKPILFASYAPKELICNRYGEILEVFINSKTIVINMTEDRKYDDIPIQIDTIINFLISNRELYNKITLNQLNDVLSKKLSRGNI